MCPSAPVLTKSLWWWPGGYFVIREYICILLVWFIGTWARCVFLRPTFFFHVLYINMYIYEYINTDINIYYIYIHIYVYTYIYRYKYKVVLSDQWHTELLKSHRSKMVVTYMSLWKQCALPVITTITLATHGTDTYATHALFSWIHICKYIHIFIFLSIYIYTYIYICIYNVYMLMYTYMNIYLIYMNKFIYICIYMYIRIHIFVHIYLYLFMHVSLYIHI